MIQLRPYQQDAVDKIRGAYRRCRRAPIYVAPTGSGKAVVVAYIAAGAQSKGNRVIVMVHRQELIRQLSRTLTDFSVPHGIIRAGVRPDPKPLTQLASVQTLVRRLATTPAPDLIVIDEAHHSTSESYRTIIAAFPDAKLLGCSATPSRLDGRGLGDVFDEIVIGPSVASLTKDGFLSPAIYYAPPSGVTTDGLHIVAGDFNKAEVEALMDKPVITGSAVDHYRKLCDGVPAIAFCTSVRHAEHVMQEFQSAGYRSAMIDGQMDDQERMDRVSGLGNGEIQVLTSVDVVSEGFDLPVCTGAILLRPTASMGLHLQQIGRVLRPAPGKRSAVIIDHVSNCMRHGLADEEREWNLDPMKRRKTKENDKIFSNRQCPSCYRVHSPSLACPECGFVYPVKPRRIDQADGSLEEITAADVAKRRAKQEVGMAKTFAELHAIEKSRGYKPGWAYMTWRFKKQRGMKTRGVAAEHGVML